MAPRKQRETAVEKILKKLYYDPKSPVCYGGKQALEEALQKELKLKNIRCKDVKYTVEKWLENQATYTIHKVPRKRFPRQRIIVGNLNQLWQSDLADLQSLAEYNDGMRFILVIIDCLSRKVWGRALKDKSGKTVAAAFSDVLKTQKPPLKLQVDLGKEFYNKDVKSLLAQHGVVLFSTKNMDTKAAMAERVIQTLKKKLWGYFDANRTYRWVDILQDIIDGYNTRVHSVTKYAPNDVTGANTYIVRRNIENYRSGVQKKKRFHGGDKKQLKVGDLVRITAAAHIFKKGYLPQWTREIFKVREVVNSTPILYKLEDLNKDSIEGRFYRQELQKVTSLPRVYEIDEILEEKGNKIFVSWRGYPKSMAQWIKKSALRRL